MADQKYMEKQVYDVSLGSDVYKVYVSLGGSEQLTRLTLSPSAEPTAPAEGMIYYDATANKLMFYNGTSWETVTSS